MLIESPSSQKEILKIEKLKTDAYLKLISIAVCETNNNRGTLRKIIWAYLMKNFREAIDYRDFLYCITDLLKHGKLVNKSGYYFVQNAVYEEMLNLAPI